MKHRFSLTTVAPIRDGKAEVNQDSLIWFNCDPNFQPASDQTRTEPLYETGRNHYDELAARQPDPRIAQADKEHAEWQASQTGTGKQVHYHAGADIPTGELRSGTFTTPDRVVAEQFARNFGHKKSHEMHLDASRSATEKDVIKYAKKVGIYEKGTPIGQYFERDLQGPGNVQKMINYLTINGFRTATFDDGMGKHPSTVVLSKQAAEPLTKSLALTHLLRKSNENHGEHGRFASESGQTTCQPTLNISQTGTQPHDYVLFNGKKDIAILPKLNRDSALLFPQLPIRLRVGKHEDRYGLDHISEKHGEEIAKYGMTPAEYVHHLIKHANKIYDVTRDHKLLLECHTKPGRHIWIQLRNNGGFYSVITTFKDTKWLNKGKLVWSGRNIDMAPAIHADPLLQKATATNQSVRLSSYTDHRHNAETLPKSARTVLENQTTTYRITKSATDDKSVKPTTHNDANKSIQHPKQLIKAARTLHGRIDFNGLQISIETGRSRVREWHNPQDDTSGMSRMTLPYGYIKGTLGVDGDHVDVFVGPDNSAPDVYVVHTTVAPDFTGYDEDKCYVGVGSPEEAKRYFHTAYSEPRFYGSMSVWPFDEFKTAEYVGRLYRGNTHHHHLQKQRIHYGGRRL